jgi:hypothetical protein
VIDMKQIMTAGKITISMVETIVCVGEVGEVNDLISVNPDDTVRGSCCAGMVSGMEELMEGQLSLICWSPLLLLATLKYRSN